MINTAIDIKSEVIILESYEFILKQTSEGAMLKTAAKKKGGGDIYDFVHTKIQYNSLTADTLESLFPVTFDLNLKEKL